MDELGDPVARRDVLFYDGGAYVGKATTADDGSFAFEFTVPENAGPGDHTLTARFQRDGVEYYWGSEASITVRYSSRPEIKEVNVVPREAGIGSTVKVEAVVEDRTGLSSVVLEVSSPHGDTYRVEMACTGNRCSAEFGDTWVAGEYGVTVRATNIDGITATYADRFTVEGHATFGVQVEGNVYGALEDVLLRDGKYWGNPLSTYAVFLDAGGVSDRDVAVTANIPSEHNPFGVISSYDFVRYDGAEVSAFYGQGYNGNALLLSGSGYVIFPVTSHIKPQKSITLAGWVRIDSTAGDRYALALTASDGSVIYGLYSKEGTSKMCFTLRADGQQYTACSDSLGIGEWHFVTATFDGETACIYVDG
ncbi:TPA: hypothetical protein EYP13_04685, partial [Candidatus Micrarchaeota archaeon]|nr:hypothetical protein [Candidatus Micrarchaeota archaeon]